jgi:hypothetical protein
MGQIAVDVFMAVTGCVGLLFVLLGVRSMHVSPGSANSEYGRGRLPFGGKPAIGPHGGC